MEHKKDIPIENTMPKGQVGDVSHAHYQNNKQIKPVEQNTVFKRTQKIGTALYMVTECVPDHEPLKNRLRTCTIQLLGKVSSLNAVSAIRTQFIFEELENTIREMLGLLELGHVVGILGVMNSSILMKEFTLLSGIVEQLKKENKEGKFAHERFRSQTLESFVVPKEIVGNHEESPVDGASMPDYATKEIPGAVYSQGHEELLKKYMSFNKGHTDKSMSFRNTMQANTEQKRSLISPNGHSKKIELALKNERRNTIFNLIKDKQEIMIKDIAAIIKNCSEKTLQRELSSLVSEGVLKKTGEKRWSRYSLA